MKQLFKLIKYYWNYIIYVTITQKERHLYSIGKIEGYKCIDYKTDTFGRTYVYDRDKSPTRDYITYKEYKELHHPNKKLNVSTIDMNESRKSLELRNYSGYIKIK